MCALTLQIVRFRSSSAIQSTWMRLQMKAIRREFIARGYPSLATLVLWCWPLHLDNASQSGDFHWMARDPQMPQVSPSAAKAEFYEHRDHLVHHVTGFASKLVRWAWCPVGEIKLDIAQQTNKSELEAMLFHHNTRVVSHSSRRVSEAKLVVVKVL